MGIRSVLILMCGMMLSASSQMWAREINSREDEIRLSGYQDYLKNIEAAEKLRRSGVNEIAKEKARDWDAQEKALKEYKREKARSQAQVLDETSSEWHEYVKEKLKAYAEYEKDRENFIKERSQKRLREHKIINLSEEEELAIADNSPRVDWRKRKFAEGGSSGARSSFDHAPTFTPPPAYTPPPYSNTTPGYFDAPPPPPMYEPFDEGMYPPPPPPPPPMFEDESPF